MSYQCANCKRTFSEPLETHHISYVPEIAIELCPQCHKKVKKIGHPLGFSGDFSVQSGRKVRTTVHLPYTIWANLKAVSEATGHTVNALVMSALYTSLPRWYRALGQIKLEKLKAERK